LKNLKILVVGITNKSRRIVPKNGVEFSFQLKYFFSMLLSLLKKLPS